MLNRNSIGVLVLSVFLAPSLSVADDLDPARERQARQAPAREGMEEAMRQEAARQRAAAEEAAARDAAAKTALRAAKVAQRRDAAAHARGRISGDILPGDDPEYVRQQWGEPERVRRVVSSYGVAEWWFYGGQRAVHFVNGVAETVHTGW